MIFARTSSALACVMTPPRAAGISTSTSRVSSSSFVIGSRTAVAGEPPFVIERIAQHGGHVEPLGPIITAAVIAESDDTKAGFVEEFCRVRADVAESLDRDPRVDRLAAQPHEHLVRQDADPAPGRFFAPWQPVQFDRFAGDAGGAVAVILGVLIHEPAHHFGIGSHVGGRNVGIGSDDVVDIVDEAACDQLQLARAEFRRVDGQSPFGAAIGKIDDGRLPGHQRRQRTDLVHVDIGMIRRPPFIGPRASSCCTR